MLSDIYLPNIGTDQGWHKAQVIKHDLFLKPNQSLQSHGPALLIHKPDGMCNPIQSVCSFERFPALSQRGIYTNGFYYHASAYRCREVTETSGIVHV